MAKYYANIFGIKIKGSDWRIVLLFPVVVIAMYLMSALILYAFVQLTKMLSFSWMNAVWTSILLYAAHWIFSSSDNEQ